MFRIRRLSLSQLVALSDVWGMSGDEDYEQRAARGAPLGADENVFTVRVAANTAAPLVRQPNSHSLVLPPAWRSAAHNGGSAVRNSSAVAQAVEPQSSGAPFVPAFLTRHSTQQQRLRDARTAYVCCASQDLRAIGFANSDESLLHPAHPEAMESQGGIRTDIPGSGTDIYCCRRRRSTGCVDDVM